MANSGGAAETQEMEEDGRESTETETAEGSTESGLLRGLRNVSDALRGLTKIEGENSSKLPFRGKSLSDVPDSSASASGALDELKRLERKDTPDAHSSLSSPADSGLGSSHVSPADSGNDAPKKHTTYLVPQFISKHGQVMQNRQMMELDRQMMELDRRMIQIQMLDRPTLERKTALKTQNQEVWREMMKRKMELKRQKGELEREMQERQILERQKELERQNLELLRQIRELERQRLERPTLERKTELERQKRELEGQMLERQMLELERKTELERQMMEIQKLDRPTLEKKTELESRNPEVWREMLELQRQMLKIQTLNRPMLERKTELDRQMRELDREKLELEREMLKRKIEPKRKIIERQKLEKEMELGRQLESWSPTLEQQIKENQPGEKSDSQSSQSSQSHSRAQYEGSSQSFMVDDNKPSRSSLTQQNLIQNTAEKESPGVGSSLFFKEILLDTTSPWSHLEMQGPSSAVSQYDAWANSSVLSIDRPTKPLSQYETQDNSSVLSIDRPTKPLSQYETQDNSSVPSIDRPTKPLPQYETHDNSSVPSIDHPSKPLSQCEAQDNSSVLSIDRPTKPLFQYGARGESSVLSINRPIKAVPNSDQKQDHPIKPLFPYEDPGPSSDHSKYNPLLMSLRQQESSDSMSSRPHLQQPQEEQTRGSSLNSFDMTDCAGSSDPNKGTVFTPQKIPLFREMLYRFRCRFSGVFRCSSTGLVFVVTKEAELQYRTVQWDQTLLQSSGRVPSGPLYDIECPERAVCELHLPHCEAENVDVSQSQLSVAHFSRSGLEFIKPVQITDSHVIIPVSSFSKYGLTDTPQDNKPISGQVMLFRTPKEFKERILNMFLLPRNTPRDTVVKAREGSTTCTEFIDAPSKCKLIIGFHYSVICPNAESIQPERSELDMDNEPNYPPIFQLRFAKKTTKAPLKINETENPEEREVWKYDLRFKDSACVPITRPPTTLLSSLELLRPMFVQKVSNPNLDALLDRLMSNQFLNQGEVDMARENPRADKARFVLDTVLNKGPRAVEFLIEEYCKLDPQSELCEELQKL